MLFNNKKMMNIVITLNCDSKCKHCYIKSVDDKSSKDLSVDVWKKVLLKFKQSGGQEICIHGGEPLMYEGISEILLFANSIGLNTSIITNALHLKRDIITVLAQTNTYTLVSLDGPRDNYMMFRGEDKLDLVTENIDKMLDENITIHPIAVIHNKNIDQLSWLIDFVSRRKIKTVTLSPIQPIGRASEAIEYHITHDNINNLIGVIKRLNHEYKGQIRFVTQALYTPENIDKYLANEESLASYNDHIINILNDGRVLLDLDVPNRDDFAIGTILDMDKLNNRVLDDYKKLVKKAYFEGLNELRNEKAINFFEVLQRQAFQMMGR